MINNLLADPLLLGFVVLGISTLILLAMVIWLYMKMRSFLVGVDSKNISDSLSHVSTSLKDLEKFRTELEEYLLNVEKRIKKSVQSVHTVRFNPFKGTGGGGNQSFATAFLTEDGEGVVLSSLYSRDHVSVFAKPVRGHTSEHELSEEEEQALTNALKNLREKK